MPPPETLGALTSDEFLAGLVYGSAALVLGLFVAYVWRRWRSTPAPIAGVLLATAAMLAMRVTRELPHDLSIGIVLLAIGGSLFPWVRNTPMLAAVLAVPGAWWVTKVVELPAAEWVSWMLFGWIVIGAPLVTMFDRHFANRGYGPLLLVVSIAGMYATLPDTEEILVLLGAAVPLSLLAWPKVVASLGSVGVYAAFGVMTWIVAEGGRGRESAIIGSTACLALLLVEPVVRMWRSQTLLDRVPNRWWWVPVVAGLQVVFVLFAARVAGLVDTPLLAALLTVMVTLVAAASMTLAGDRSAARSRT